MFAGVELGVGYEDGVCELGLNCCGGFEGGNSLGLKLDGLLIGGICGWLDGGMPYR